MRSASQHSLSTALHGRAAVHRAVQKHRTSSSLRVKTFSWAHHMLSRVHRIFSSCTTFLRHDGYFSHHQPLALRICTPLTDDLHDRSRLVYTPLATHAIHQRFRQITCCLMNLESVRMSGAVDT